MTAIEKLAAGAALGVVALGVLWYAKGKLPALAGQVGHAINPLNQENVFYTGVNDMGAAASGNPSFNLGAWAWEVLNPGAVAREREALGSSPAYDYGWRLNSGIPL